jgi:hypothetical protein
LLQDELRDEGVSHSVVLVSQLVIEKGGLAAVIVYRLFSFVVKGGRWWRFIVFVIILDIH